MQLSCGIIFSNYHFIRNFPQNVPVKKNLKIVNNIWRRYGQKFAAYVSGHPVHGREHLRSGITRQVTIRYYSLSW